MVGDFAPQGRFGPEKSALVGNFDRGRDTQPTRAELVEAPESIDRRFEGLAGGRSWSLGATTKLSQRRTREPVVEGATRAEPVEAPESIR
jgi:hypothetical protein